jgi:tetratricopeptide (TPR) repeat protein
LPNVAMEVDEGLLKHRTLSGFLGGNILENFVVTVDYEKKQVILANSLERNTSKEAIIVPMKINKHRPYCSVNLEDRLEVTALLDTGSPGNLSADVLLTPVLENGLIFNERSFGPWLGEVNTGTVRLKSINIGASSFEGPIFEVFPAVEAPLARRSITLGNSFLSRFKTVTFDYPGRRIVFEPGDPAKTPPLSLYSEGRYYLNHHDWQQAIASFSRSIMLDNELSERSYKGRGHTFMIVGQYEQALRDFDEVIKLDPKDSWGYEHRAFVYGQLGQYRHQIDDDTMSIHLDPMVKTAYIDRAWAYDKLGKHNLAERDRQTAKRFSQE